MNDNNRKMNFFRFGILFIMFAFFPLLSGFPTFELGQKITKFNTEFVYVDYEGNNWFIFKKYWGLTTEALMSPVNNLYVRMEIFEIRKYNSNDRLYCNLFSSLSLDIEYIIPIWFRLSPSIYLGFKYGRLNGHPQRDPQHIPVNHEFHWGCGFVYRINRKYNIIFETHIYTDNQFWLNNFEPDAPWNFRIQTVGHEKVCLGLRYKL